LATHFSFLRLDWHSSHSTLPTQHFAKLGLRSCSTTCIVKFTIFITATDRGLCLTCCYLQASPGRQATRRHVLGYLYGHLTYTFTSRGLKLTRNSDIGTADRLPSLLRITTLRRSRQIPRVARQHRARVACNLRSHCHQPDRGHCCRAFSVREEVIQPTHRIKSCHVSIPTVHIHSRGHFRPAARMSSPVTPRSQTSTPSPTSIPRLISGSLSQQTYRTLTAQRATRIIFRATRETLTERRGLPVLPQLDTRSAVAFTHHVGGQYELISQSAQHTVPLS